MAALTEPRYGTKRRKSPYDHEYKRQEVAAGVTVFQGAWVGWDATRKIVLADDAVQVLGRASCPDGYSSAAGEYVDVDSGTFLWANLGDAFTIADCGSIVYAADDQSGNATDTNPPGGILHDVTTEGIWVTSAVGIGTLEASS